MSERPDDRLGLDAFDRVDAPDQWDDIVARADSTSPLAADLHRGRGPAVWFMAAAAAGLSVVAVVAVAARSGDEATTPATTPDDTVATSAGTASPSSTVRRSWCRPTRPSCPRCRS